MTDDRIKTAQEEIQKILVAKPEYVVNTSRVQRCEGPPGDAAQPPQGGYRQDSNRPRLRRAPGSGTGPVDENEDGKKPKTDQDERPTLKRRDG